jgi:branched-chain amino acid transport system substrate-binding protein
VARHRAQAQDAVERLGAVAFLSEGAPLSGTGTLDYLKQKQIPVVGTETGVSWSVEHPMYFPQSTSGLPMFESLIRGVAQQLLPTGKKSVGVVYCTETPMCDVHRKMWEKSAPEVGLKYVFSGQASLAQPDFTAICLSARNAGADALLFSMDGASIRRVAQACTRQGYRPLYASVAGILFDEFKSEDSLQTVVGTSPFYPYFKTDLPAIQEFAQAVARFGSPDLTGIGPLTGWTSGKLFERVTKALPEPPTSTAILDGLYTVKNDDLGGLAVPLTFTKGEDHATVPQCWWNLKVQNKAWASADNYQRNCR